MKTQKPLLYALCCWLLFVTDAGALNLPEAIVGKWHKINGKDVFEVFEGGRIFANVKGFSFEGNYNFIDDKSVRCDFNFGSVVYTVRVSENTLILTDRKGKVTKYQRKTKTNEANSSVQHRVSLARHVESSFVNHK